MAGKENEVVVEKKKGGIGGVIVAILILLVLLIAALGALIKFDVLGLGTKVIGPHLVEIPVINMILPEMPVEEGGFEENGEIYSFETVEEAIEALKTSEKLLKESEETDENLSEEIKTKDEEITRLKVFETNQVTFEQDKEAFDQLVAESAGDADFKEYVEKVYQENALAIYEEIVKKEQVDEKAQIVYNLYTNMEPSSAAPLLEQTAKTDMEMVVDIVSNLNSEQAGEILSLIETKTADRITRYIYPEEK